MRRTLCCPLFLTRDQAADAEGVRCLGLNKATVETCTYGH
jgi:hypothetical protein